MNLVYLFSLNGWNILHEGDSDGKQNTFRDMKPEDVALDLALVHFWFPLDPEGAKILQDELKPSHIGLIHLPKQLEKDAPGKIAAISKYYDDIILLLPNTGTLTFR